MCRNYYMVRAMLSEEEDFKVFFDNSVVAVGWSDVDFTKCDNSDILREQVNKEYYLGKNKSPSKVSQHLNEVARFKNIQAGDYIVIPYYSDIIIAVAEEEEIYSLNDKERDLANQRKVAYRYIDNELLKISRNELSEGLQRRLRVRGMTVNTLFEFKDEIELIFSRQSYSYNDELSTLEQPEGKTVFSFEIIDRSGYEMLSEYTDEIVYYIPDLDVYLWGITHCGIGWTEVLTPIPIP